MAALLERHEITTGYLWDDAVDSSYGDNFRATGAAGIMNVASSHPISNIVIVLGIPPEYMVEESRRHCRSFDGCNRIRNQARRGGVDGLIFSGT